MQEKTILPIRCPQCQTRNRLKKADFIDKPVVSFKCVECGAPIELKNPDWSATEVTGTLAEE